tara:strand:- start:606 stop:1097 length:492 start_codon:yes stop_codon:yes gene_type:complete
MPQLNPEFFVSQLFWLAVFFSFLLIFLWKVSLPRIASVLQKRQSRINDDLSSAKELQEQAREIEKKINIKLSDAKNETDNKLKSTAQDLQNQVSHQLSSLDKELDEKVSKSEVEIKATKTKEMENIHKEISNITKVTLAKISDIEIQQSDLDAIIKSYKGSLN